MTRVGFHVDGKPVPQGSSRAFVVKKKGDAKARAIVTNDDDGSINKWRADVRDAARKALPVPFALLEGPVRLAVSFFVARPQSHFLPATKSRPAGILRDDAPFYCVGRGDVDKHVRSIMDALTLVVYGDDDQVVRLWAEKQWALHPGAAVIVESIDE